MARILNRRDMLAVTGKPGTDKPMSGIQFDAMLNRGALALTFGTPRAVAANRYFASDPVYVRAVIEFGRKLRLPPSPAIPAKSSGQAVVAALMRLDNLTVLEGIVRAEAHPELQLGLALIYGAGAMQLFCGTEDELRTFLFGPPLEGRLQRPSRFEQVTVINLTDLIASIRRQAARVNVDLSTPLFLSPDDPRWAEIKAELTDIRAREASQIERAAALAALRMRITEGLTLQ